MNILTFDLEEWWHILDSDKIHDQSRWDGYESRIHRNTDRILDLLDDRSRQATFFCLGWVAEKYPEVIRKIRSRGHDLGIHSYAHELIYRQNRSEFSEDLRRSIGILQDLTGEKVTAYRAPGFSLTPDCNWVIPELAQEGIQIDCSIFPARRAHGGYHSFPRVGPLRIRYDGVTMKEFPINTWNVLFSHIVFSGGGYFRFFPYPVIRSLTRQSKYLMTYFHPRDFDPEQPVIKDLPALRKFRHYIGLKNAFNKLERYLEDFDFMSVKEADKSIRWDETAVVNLDQIQEQGKG